MKSLSHSRWFHPLLLLVWLAIGTGLRFTHLSAKPPWSDEISTLVFSLGNSFRTVPLDRAIALDTLLMPLQPNAEAGIRAVIHNLMTESNHPPVYFVLTHLWLKLFPTEGGLVSVWGARALSAIVGVASVPAMFGLGCVAFRSRLVAQIAAATIAVSPYSIYLAQEIRHYTLAILLLIASLCCLVIATRAIHRRIPLPLWVGLIWVGVNSLGIAVHYFFTLAVCAEALVLVGCGINWQTPRSYWRRIYVIAAVTLMAGLVWLPVWQRVSKNQVTLWIYDQHPLNNWLETIGRVLAWMITMLSLLPVEGTTQPIMLACAAVLVIFVLWALPIFICGFRIQLGRIATRKETQALSGLMAIAIALLLGITYGLGADLTIAARYQFIYFPALIVLIAATLAICWNASSLAVRIDSAWTKRQQQMLRFLQSQGKKAVILIWLMGCLGGLTVVWNFGYQKPDRPDLLVPIIQQGSHVPIAIATIYETHVQTGKLIGLAWEFKRTHRSVEPATTSRQNSPLFILANQASDSRNSIDAVQRSLTQIPRPLDLWLVNFTASAEPDAQNCQADSQYRSKVNGYRYRLYHCK